jgi:hypothetical protein
MKRLVDTANKRNITVETKLYELPRQMKDKGITPSITSLRKEENEVKITGTALLQKSGQLRYKFSPGGKYALVILQGKHVKIRSIGATG